MEILPCIHCYNFPIVYFRKYFVSRVGSMYDMINAKRAGEGKIEKKDLRI